MTNELREVAEVIETARAKATAEYPLPHSAWSRESYVGRAIYQALRKHLDSQGSA